jgi:hypothetical protein
MMQQQAEGHEFRGEVSCRCTDRRNEYINVLQRRTAGCEYELGVTEQEYFTKDYVVAPGKKKLALFGTASRCAASVPTRKWT